MRYEGRIFRPPSEAGSLIIQFTIGCSHNRCDFCDMYKEKTYHEREIQLVLDDLLLARCEFDIVERMFIADGDALIRNTNDWVLLFEHIRSIFPECKRVSCYASPRSILRKSEEDLKLLCGLGLGMVYMGLESGSDIVLQNMSKGEAVDEIVSAGIKAKGAGFKLSVTAISGLGGKTLWEEHAVKTGEALSRMKPDYIGLLALMVVENTPLYERISTGSFEVLSPEETTTETLMMLEHLDSEGSVFRSNHPSNYLALRGTLNHDIPQMKDTLKEALGGRIVYRNERTRRL